MYSGNERHTLRDVTISQPMIKNTFFISRSDEGSEVPHYGIFGILGAFLSLAAVAACYAACHSEPPPTPSRPAAGNAGRSRQEAASVGFSVVGDVSRHRYVGLVQTTARIHVHGTFTEEQLRGALQYAVREIDGRKDSNATMVFAVRSPEASETLGRAVFAPNGRWYDIAKDAPRRVTVQLGDFSKPGVVWHRGKEVRLVPDEWSTEVEVFRDSNRDDPDSVLVKVPADALATVVGRRERRFTHEYAWLRYRVRVEFGSQTRQGWVESWNVRER